MFKRSLLTAAILGAFVAAAGAHSEGEAEKAKDLQTPQLEFVFEAAPAACGVDGSEAQSEAWFDSLLEQQTSSQLEESQVAWGRFRGPRLCIMCYAWVCYTVPC